jgi:DNA-binding Xre family transcriptional regulator
VEVCGISYYKLRELLRENKILYKHLKEDAGVTGDELAKIRYDERYMTTQSLERIARYLSTKLDREITFDDLIEIKK